MRFAFRACSANLRPASSRSSLLVCFLRAIACARHCFFSSRWFAASSQTLFSMTSACMFVVIPHVVPRDGCAKSEMLCVWQNEGVTILRSLRGMMRSDPNAIDVPRFIQAHGLHVPIILRPLTTDDCDEWNEVRWRNDDWLKPWESGDPVHGASMSFNEWVRAMRCNERNGTGVVFAIEHHGRIVGQISLGAICYGAMRTGVVGYWVDERCAGRGYAPMAVTLLADWAMFDPSGPQLHRVEIDLLPENERSRKVALKVGASYEGMRKAYMFVNGQWRDHESYALLPECAPNGFTARLMGE